MSSLGFYFSQLIKKAYQLSGVKSDFNEPIIEFPKTNQKNRYLGFVEGLLTSNTIIETSERIVENPFLFMNIPRKKGAKILEVGCSRSRIAIELASLGYKVTGNDLKPYKYTHPNFTFIQGDLRYVNLKNKSYDCITSISTIEHTGLGAYKEKVEIEGDQAMVDKIYKLLKPGGSFIITLPYGKRGINNQERVYDEKSIIKLLSKFKIIKKEYYSGFKRKYWIPENKAKLKKMISHKKYTQGVVCILAVK